jgi:hypothetical protein
MAHIVSTSQPPSGALGDEWFDPATNKLYKLVAAGGTNVVWQDYSPFYSANVVSGLSAGQNIVLAANGQISSTASGGGAATPFLANVEYTYTAKQIFQGNTAALAMKMINVAEATIVSGTSLGTVGNTIVNIDLSNSSIVYYTTAASGNWNFNFRTSPGTALNSSLGIGESVSAVVMATQGFAPYYANSVLIDGVTIVPKWQDAIVPTSGNASSIDIYNYTIIKTSNAAFTILGSQSRFA